MPSNFHQCIFTLLWIAVSLLAVGCGRNTQVRIPVVSHQDQQIIATLEANVYKPKGESPFPVVIFNHGSTGGKPAETYLWTSQAKYFVSKGFVVIAPMRKGRGKSSGISQESEDKNCELGGWDAGIYSAFEDLDAVIQFVETIPQIDNHRIHLLGQSRGGFLSVAYAAEGKYKNKIKSVINFSGGWVAQKEDQCPQDFNEIAFARYGSKSTLPMIWLYGKGDLYFGDESVESYQKIFQNKGATVEFHLIEGIPNNGHALIEHPNKWEGFVDQFLSQFN